jgi:hypothetical protein
MYNDLTGKPAGSEPGRNPAGGQQGDLPDSSKRRFSDPGDLRR